MAQQNVDLAALAEQGVAISNQIAQLKERLDAIKTVMRAAHSDVGAHTYGDAEVILKGGFKFDPDTAEKVIRERAPERLAEVVVARPDAKLVKQVLGEELYRACQVESTVAVQFGTAS